MTSRSLTGVFNSQRVDNAESVLCHDVIIDRDVLHHMIIKAYGGRHQAITLTNIDSSSNAFVAFTWEQLLKKCWWNLSITSQIAKFMGPTWSPPGFCGSQMGPMLAPWTLLSGMGSKIIFCNHSHISERPMSKIICISPWPLFGIGPW